ncbi:fasciclin domain-containing protein [Maribacter sp. MAR_2009_72]|uniref:fasciclin domain-containing protein n=1 Tax=Maribacter sp. MAR_2009_72 TaxID=1250050 RepID=UPI00119C5F64|nr:fasciclin domain-containing protein [Maribacter sp. MAR_2009_72]TVZ14290.1 putative surface protein with fasciclin (FAS1) repeats [Maribacter sp. MAR_2009_72]
MTLRNLKTLVCLGMILFALNSCKDQAKIDADKKAMEDQIAMEEAKFEAEAEKAKVEAKKNEMKANSIAALAHKNNELSTLLSAVKAADLEAMLSEPGNYTVFAPSNNAFEKLPNNRSIAELGKEENKELLTNILQYHVINDIISTDKLVDNIKEANGKYVMTTVAGSEITAGLKNDKIVLKDEKGNKSEIVLGNVKASNGIIHIINDVLLTK